MTSAPWLVADINQTTAAVGSIPLNFFSGGDALYFTANDGVTGRELWKSDGTAAGTFAVTDVSPGLSDSFSNWNDSTRPIATLGNSLFFVPPNVGNGRELWKTDGVAGQAVRVATPAGPNQYIGAMASLNGFVYFSVGDYQNPQNSGLWRTDGTAQGTVRFVSGVWADEFEALGNVLYFRNERTSAGLWRTDGTAAGTFALGAQRELERGIIRAGSTLYFTARDETQHVGLWKSNGTAAGTVRVHDISPAFGIVPLGNSILFVADDGAHGYEMWRSDGSTAGTYMLRDMKPGSESGGPFDVEAVGDKVYFTATDLHTNELWSTDGTIAGTKKVNVSGELSSPSSLTNVNGVLYFTGSSGALGKVSPGSTGATLVHRFDPTSGTSARDLTNVNGKLFFSSYESEHGVELWTSDGTSAGTKLVKDIFVATASASPQGFAQSAGTLFFNAYDGIHGAELWKSLGEGQGAALVRDINPGPNGSQPREMTNVNGTIFFNANDGVSGAELWKSDGTASGTVRVKDIRPGSDASYPFQLAEANGLLYFWAEGSTTLHELWRSDGTAAGTIRLFSVSDAVAYNNSNRVVNVNGTVYFVADDGVNGSELWKTDGTLAGTIRVSNINPGAASAQPGNLINASGTLFFTADDGVHGRQLWRSSGTAATTVPASNFPQTADGVAIWSELVELGGHVYFAANGDATGVELWKSDGTPAGTIRVKDILPGATGSRPENFTTFGGHLYFTADDGVHGRELWRTDGSAGGTTMVYDFALGGGFRPNSWVSYAEFAGNLYFAPSSYRGQIWMTDGTAAGTQHVASMSPNSLDLWGQSTGYVGGFTPIGETLYFIGSEHFHGAELWALRDAPVPLPGDYNADGVVSGNDFLLWQRQFGKQSATPLEADGNRNGIVDAADLALIKDHFGMATPPAVAASLQATSDIAAVESVFAAEATEWTSNFASSDQQRVAGNGPAANDLAVDAAFASSLIADEQTASEKFLRRLRSARSQIRR